MCCTACCPHFDKCAVWLQSKLSDRVLIAINLIICALLLLCVAFRFVYINEGDTRFFFIILSIYLVLFVVGLILAEFKFQMVRKYVNFLDSKFGRGCFMIFLAFLILENHALEIISFIVIIIVGIMNMIIGCK